MIMTKASSRNVPRLGTSFVDKVIKVGGVSRTSLAFLLMVTLPTSWLLHLCILLPVGEAQLKTDDLAGLTGGKLKGLGISPNFSLVPDVTSEKPEEPVDEVKPETETPVRENNQPRTRIRKKKRMRKRPMHGPRANDDQEQEVKSDSNNNNANENGKTRRKIKKLKDDGTEKDIQPKKKKKGDERKSKKKIKEKKDEQGKKEKKRKNKEKAVENGYVPPDEMEDNPPSSKEDVPVERPPAASAESEESNPEPARRRVMPQGRSLFGDVEPMEEEKLESSEEGQESKDIQNEEISMTTSSQLDGIMMNANIHEIASGPFVQPTTTDDAPEVIVTPGKPEEEEAGEEEEQTSMKYSIIESQKETERPTTTKPAKTTTELPKEIDFDKLFSEFKIPEKKPKKEKPKATIPPTNVTKKPNENDFDFMNVKGKDGTNTKTKDSASENPPSTSNSTSALKSSQSKPNTGDQLSKAASPIIPPKSYAVQNQHQESLAKSSNETVQTVDAVQNVPEQSIQKNSQEPVQTQTADAVQSQQKRAPDQSLPKNPNEPVQTQTVDAVQAQRRDAGDQAEQKPISKNSQQTVDAVPYQPQHDERSIPQNSQQSVQKVEMVQDQPSRNDRPISRNSQQTVDTFQSQQSPHEQTIPKNSNQPMKTVSNGPGPGSANVRPHPDGYDDDNHAEGEEEISYEYEEYYVYEDELDTPNAPQRHSQLHQGLVSGARSKLLM